MFVSRLLRSSCLAAVLLTACSIQTRQPARASEDEHTAHMMAADKVAPRVASASDFQGTPGLPPSNSSATARLAASTRHAEWVKIPWGGGASDSLMAWIVYPSTTRAKTPVVVVVHEIFGLSSWVRGVADQMAAEGFIAIAPDLVSRARGGPSADELRADSASKIIRNVSNAEKNLGIDAAANYAMSLPSAAPKFGVVGYCWGGATTWGAAVHNAKGFSGGVAYYGSPYMNPATPGGAPATPIADSLAKIMAPVMMLNGANDARNGAAMPGIDSAMKALGKSYTGTNYAGAAHGFLRLQDDPQATRELEAANLTATKDAWPKTVAFFKKNLGLN